MFGIEPHRGAAVRCLAAVALLAAAVPAHADAPVWTRALVEHAEAVPAAVLRPIDPRSASLHRQAADYYLPILEVSGLEGAQLDETYFRLVELSHDLERRLGTQPGYRHARKLHTLLHERHLLHYDPHADGLEQVVERGRFNCLSGSLIYVFIASRVGYEASVLELPGHLMVRLRFDDRVIDIETTSPEGFDIVGHYSRLAERDAGFRVLEERSSFGAYGGADGGVLFATARQAVAFAWLNAGWRQLEAGRPEQVAASVLRAAEYHPELIGNAEGVRRLLAKAFQAGYESGAFDQAWRVAVAEFTALPQSTTARDRLLAVGMKRVLAAVERDRPDEALALVDRVAALVGEHSDRRRFEREALPDVVRAFARLGSLDAARDGIGRYCEVERDAVEVRRLADWLRERAS